MLYQTKNARRSGSRASIRRNEAHCHDREVLARLSSEELVNLLLRDGATVVSRRDYGVLLQTHHHLIFVRDAPVVAVGDLLDALEAAGVGPGRFDRLLEEIRHAAPGPNGPLGARPAPSELVEPRRGVEQELAQIWARLLGVPHVGSLDDFFELGGDLIVAPRVMVEIEKRFGVHLPRASLV
jgi:hypothetical protein